MATRNPRTPEKRRPVPGSPCTPSCLPWKINVKVKIKNARTAAPGSTTRPPGTAAPGTAPGAKKNHLAARPPPENRPRTRPRRKTDADAEGHNPPFPNGATLSQAI